MTRVLDDGSLLITADNRLREDLKSATSRSYDHAESVVAEAIRPLGYEFIAPEAVGALTSAPIIAHDPECPDRGLMHPHEGDPVWWFPNYMVSDPWEELKNKGRVIFTKAESV